MKIKEVGNSMAALPPTESADILLVVSRISDDSTIIGSNTVTLMGCDDVTNLDE